MFDYSISILISSWACPPVLIGSPDDDDTPDRQLDDSQTLLAVGAGLAT